MQKVHIPRSSDAISKKFTQISDEELLQPGET